MPQEEALSHLVTLPDEGDPIDISEAAAMGGATAVHGAGSLAARPAISEVSYLDFMSLVCDIVLQYTCKSVSLLLGIVALVFGD